MTLCIRYHGASNRADADQIAAAALGSASGNVDQVAAYRALARATEAQKSGEPGEQAHKVRR